MTIPLVVGNWKMNGTRAVCVELARKIVDDLRKQPASAEVVLAPPFTALSEVKKITGKIAIAAQNCHW